MDPLTHALAGAALGRATASRTPRTGALSIRARVTAGLLAAIAPDVDGLIRYVSPVAYLEHHRGLTHSLLLLPLWALALAWLFATIVRDPRGARPWFGICAIGIASHIALDVITSYGTMLAAPVSWHRFSLDSTFIIDLWLSGLLVAGLVASLVLPRTPVPARLACGAVVAYVALQSGLHTWAETVGARHAASLGLADARVAAHPRPVSPFNWTVYVEGRDAVHFTHVNLIRRRVHPAPAADAGFIERLDAPYRPLADAQWHVRSRFGDTDAERMLANAAWRADDLAFFRRFADLPVYDGTTPGQACIWFLDLRFAAPGRDAVPFRYGACRDAEARWRVHEVDATGQAVLLIR